MTSTPTYQTYSSTRVTAFNLGYTPICSQGINNPQKGPSRTPSA